MRATDILTMLSVDFDYLTITGVLLQLGESSYPVTNIIIEKEAIVFIPGNKGEEGLAVSQITTTLMLNRSKSLLKEKNGRLRIYGYKIQAEDIVL